VIIMKSLRVIISALVLLSTAGLVGCAQAGAGASAEMVSTTIAPGAPSSFTPSPSTTRPADDPMTFRPQFAAAVPLTPEQKADRATLAEEVANPIADLASFPLRFTYQKGVGPKNAYTMGLLAQPTVPFRLNDQWNLIVQTNVPINYLGSPANGVDSTYGLGDTLQGFYVVPVEPSRRGWLLGLGPAFQWPTATDDGLGSGKWSAGPTAAFVRQYKGWTYGGVIDQLWSFAGDDSRTNVNKTLVHPLVTYTWQTGTSLTFDSDSAYDWMAHQWTIPLQLGISQVVIRGRRPIQLTLAGRYFAEGPVGGPEWGIRFSITFLFPK
jgi:hypothetical protein